MKLLIIKVQSHDLFDVMNGKAAVIVINALYNSVT